MLGHNPGDALGSRTRPHPESVIQTATGRVVALKVHRCRWSGAYPENSLPAIAECYREAVARVEIDVCMLRDADFLVCMTWNWTVQRRGAGR